MPTDSALSTLADQRFVSLTTFRRTGEAVSTPVWAVREGNALVVTTPIGSGKVKRLRNDPRVEVRPCNRRGKVPEGATPVPGTTQLLTDDASVQRYGEQFRRKYGVEYRIFMLVERIASRHQRSRYILRITSA